MRAKELRERSLEELASLKAEARENLFRARLKNATHQLDKSSTIRAARREIARIETVIAERAKGVGVRAEEE